MSNYGAMNKPSTLPMDKSDAAVASSHTPLHGKTHITAITGDITYNNPLIRLPSTIQPYKPMLLSYSASIVSTTIGFPLDSIKTRMQTFPNQFHSSIGCLRYTLAEEGMRGLFRGIVAPLMSTSIARSIAITVYTSVKPGYGDLLSDYQITRDKVINNIPICFLSGMTAGSITSLFSCPFELTKIFSQILMLVRKTAGTESAHGLHTPMNEFLFNKKPTNVFQLGITIFKYGGGIKGLYSGYFPYHLIRDGLSSGIFYAVYETVKIVSKDIMNSQNTQASQLQSSINNQMAVMLGGAFAGLLSWIVVFPLDTLKSQYQRSILYNIVLTKSGERSFPITRPKLKRPIKALYKGFGPSITRSVLTTTIFFSLFEFMMRNIE